MPDRPAIIKNAFEPAPVQKPNVPVAADRGDGSPLVIARHPPGWKGRVVDEHDPRVIRNGGPQRTLIEPPLTINDPKRNESRGCADEPHAVEHARVGWVGQDDLVPGIRQTEESIEHRVALAAGDDNFAATVVMRSAVSLDVVGHRVFEIIPAREWQPAVRLVLADGRSGRLHGGFGWREVGVEGLHPKDVRIGAGRGRDPIDVEAWDLRETPDAH